MDSNLWAARAKRVGNPPTPLTEGEKLEDLKLMARAINEMIRVRCECGRTGFAPVNSKIQCDCGRIINTFPMGERNLTGCTGLRG